MATLSVNEAARVDQLPSGFRAAARFLAFRLSPGVIRPASSLPLEAVAMQCQAKDPASCYSHLLGVALSIAGLVTLLVESQGDPWRVVGFSIYGASLVLLYSASTIYHWQALPPRGEDILKRLDHVAIFVLIAGTYTPVCLVTLRGRWGWSVLGLVWGLALLGLLLKLFFQHLPRWSSTALYVGMGWMAVVAVVPLVRSLPVSGMIWLVTGGVLYT